MGRNNGCWSKHYATIWDHEKTASVVARLREAGVPAEYASHVAVDAVLRLSAWALANGDTGETGQLSDGKLCLEAWPEAVESKRFASVQKTGALLRAALRDAGYLEYIRGAEGIHDFQEHYFEVLNKRRENRGLPKWTRQDIVASGGRITPDQAPWQAPKEVPTEAPKKSPQRRQGRSLNDVRGSGSGSGSGVPPTPPRTGDPQAPEDPPVSLAEDLAARIGGPAKPLVAEIISRAVAEFGEDFTRGFVLATVSTPQRPYAWLDAARASHRGTSTDEAERARARRSAESWAKRAREHEAAGRTTDAAGAWGQADAFAKDAGFDPDELRDSPSTSASAWHAPTPRQTCGPPRTLRSVDEDA